MLFDSLRRLHNFPNAVKIRFCTNEKFPCHQIQKRTINDDTLILFLLFLMGSTRSPHSSPLDPHSPYTQSAASKRKSSRSDYDDHSHNNSHEYGNSHNNSDDDNESQRRHSASGSSKKKKKSKREKERRHDRHHNDSDSDSQYGARSSTTTNVSAPTQKLPPIKISLRLPALSSIVTSSSSKGFSRKKIRTDYDSEDDQLRRRHEARDYSDPEPEAPSSSSHKKKKKKHKHKHRHPNHDDENDVDHDRRDSRRERPRHHQDTAGDYEEDYEQDEDAYEAGTRRPSASKLTLRLGKTDKDSHSKERRSSKKSHKNHPSEESHAFDSSLQSQNRSDMRSPPPQRQSSPPSQPTPVYTHQRSLSQSSSRNHPLSPVEVKQDYRWPQPPPTQSTEHMQVGQKRPFAVLQSQRSVSRDIDNEPEAEEEDLDDPLAGELDEPEDYDEDEDEEEEDDNDGEDQQSDDNDTKSPSTPSGSQFGSKTVGGQLGSKTVPRSTSVPPKVHKPKAPKDAETREGSVTATSTTAKGKRKGKAAKRLMSPKSSIPVIPKKKELSAVCHKLLDQFIKYVITEQGKSSKPPETLSTDRTKFSFSNF